MALPAPSRRRGRGARIWTRGPPSTSTPLLLVALHVALAALRPMRGKWNDGDGAVRAAARLNSARCRRVCRSSVGGAQSRVSSGLPVAPWLACNKSDGAWTSIWGLVLELRVESQGRTWIPCPALLGLGRMACVRGGLIRICERTVRLMWPHWGHARPNLGRTRGGAKKTYVLHFYTSLSLRTEGPRAPQCS